jgi:hypothetical protein
LIEAQLLKTTIDMCLLNKLFPYQRAGVAFGLDKKGRLLIAGKYLLLTGMPNFNDV